MFSAVEDCDPWYTDDADVHVCTLNAPISTWNKKFRLYKFLDGQDDAILDAQTDSSTVFG